MAVVLAKEGVVGRCGCRAGLDVEDAPTWIRCDPFRGVLRAFASIAAA